MAAIVRRYEIYYAEISKIRAVVVVSQNEMNRYVDTVVVCPLTTKLHPQWRSRIQTVCDNTPAEIAVDQIRTISKKRLTRKIDTLSSGDGLKLRLLISEMYGES